MRRRRTRGWKRTRWWGNWCCSSKKPEDLRGCRHLELLRVGRRFGHSQPVFLQPRYETNRTARCVLGSNDPPYEGQARLSLPHLLLVDDSEAVLAFQRAALSGHYVVTT